MLRDVFYYGNKPNVHPREKFATSLEDAQSQSTTEHFWIINEYCDYRGFDWDFDFDFLADEDVWAEEHNNVWPSQHQKDSGTWLCNTDNTNPVTIYRADVEPVKRKNIKTDHWVELDLIDHTKFDFSWHPDPLDSPYIYKWGSKFAPVELKTCLEYHALGATQVKYMEQIVELLPTDYWVEVQRVDKDKFDMSWRPDPLDHPMIYVWGNKYIDGTLRSTLEYHAPGGTERKYMSQLLNVLPEWDRWEILHEVDKSSFDFSWRPDPREPDLIYVFGNDQHEGNIMPTIEYRMPGATERKYLDTQKAKLAPQPKRFEHLENSDGIDYAWTPDPTSPPYIYAWGNQWNKPEDKVSIQYVVEGATEYKYMEERATRKPCMDNWEIPANVDVSNFDFSWEPSPADPPFIYQFGTQWQKTGGPRYVVEDATEVKFVSTFSAKALPSKDKWTLPTNIDVTDFDFSWHPDDTSPPYVYVFPTQWALSGGPVYTVEGATEVKYVEDMVAKAIPDKTNWEVPAFVDADSFDFSWHPYVEDQPYIYQFGTQWQKTGGPRYMTPGIHKNSPIKYIDTRILKSKRLPSKKGFSVLNNYQIKDFDYSWHPDTTDEPFIYVFGNNLYPAEIMPTIEYAVPGATQIKYVNDIIATLGPDMINWEIPENIDIAGFDFSWKPNPKDPPYVYQFGTQWQRTGGPKYVVSDATEVKYVDTQKVKKLPSKLSWILPSYIDVTDFDFSWHPDDTSPPYMYYFATQWALSGGPIYVVEGANEAKYIDDIVAKAIPDKTNWEVPEFIDADSFDFSWHPYVEDQPYIYQFGTQWQKTGGPKYVAPDATSDSPIKYIDRRILKSKCLPNKNGFTTLSNYQIKDFDYSWHPDTTEEPYIYVFGNNQYPAEVMPTIEYAVPGATQLKYINDVVATLGPDMTNWEVPDNIDVTGFDFSWKPNPKDSGFIYVFGTQWQKTGGPRYVVPGATEIKFVETQKVKALPTKEKWTLPNNIDIDNFDFSWHPDDTSPPYIYYFATQWASSGGPVYSVPRAREVKYVNDLVAKALPNKTNWEISAFVDTASFDFSWHPNLEDEPYIYEFGTQWQKTGGPKYVTPGVHKNSAVKYIDARILKAKRLSSKKGFATLNNYVIKDFDYTWHPDTTDDPFIYVFGNNQYPAEIMPTIEYAVPGATQIKYINDIIATLGEDKTNWEIPDNIDTTDFDFSWKPNPKDPPFIYQFGTQWQKTGGPRYVVPDATEVKFVETQKVRALPTRTNWTLPSNIDTEFDFSWHPDDTSPPYVYYFATQWALSGGPVYTVPGATEVKYVEELVSKALPDMTNWEVPEFIDKNAFDYSWHPYVEDEPYIYQFGTQWQKTGGPIYKTPGVHKNSPTKYIDVRILRATRLPSKRGFATLDNLRIANFDYTWHPDTTEEPYIYVFGNNQYPAEIMPTIEYRIPGATEVKYINDIVATLGPDMVNWDIPKGVDTDNFDFSWKPNPKDPPYIYQFGTQWQKTGGPRYVVEGATEVKYVEDQKATISNTSMKNWEIPESLDLSEFDFSWHPDATEKPYIYVFGTQWALTGGPKYIVPDATEVKYVDSPVAKAAPNKKYWTIPNDIDENEFDFSWHPYIEDQPYIYQFGTQWQKTGGPVYTPPEADATCFTKYIDTRVLKAKKLPSMKNWEVVGDIEITDFDYSWHPDATEEPYIYVFGNNQYPGELMPTVQYVIPGATRVKYISSPVAKLAPYSKGWKNIEDVEKFDYSWRPDPTDPPYIYVFGNTLYPGTIMPTVELHIEGATEKKYVDAIIATLKPRKDLFANTKLVKDFDYSWRPNPKDPPYIYQFGTQWAKTHGPQYIVEGATETKYVDSIKAIVLPNMVNWEIPNGVNVSRFDFSWHPDANSPPYIYQFGTILDPKDGPRYVVPGATEVVNMERVEVDGETFIDYPKYYVETTLEALVDQHPGEIFWALNSEIDYTNFDFNWRPDIQQAHYVHAFGSSDSETTQTYFINSNMWMNGYRELNWVVDEKLDEQTLAKLFKKPDMFFVDRGNKESQARFEKLKAKFDNIQKTRYLNTWVDTINRCINRSTTNLCWILNSELDYDEFDFEYYPNPWQMKMVHVFGTQWSHWGTTFMVNRENFAEETKYIKIIEHLSCLNFVKDRRAKATNILYDTVYIDHGNKPVPENTLVIEYEESYLVTFKKLLEKLPEKKEHYVWVTSSICDYNGFDFTYICDPFAREQLHVFPSDKQKFGDTFLVNVNKLRELIDNVEQLEDIKVNYNQHMRVKRLPAPTIITEGDTHVSSIHTDFDFPYATFQTIDNQEIKVVDVEPMNLWSKETKTIQITSVGGTRIVVPKEVKNYVKRELYDYPYIQTNKTLAKSTPMDIVFLSNGETGADENYEHLLRTTQGLSNRVVRVDGVDGRVAAYHAAAEVSNTPWMFTVFAKLKVSNKFDWNWQPDRMQLPKHYVFHAKNPVNGLVYGHMAMIAYNKKLTLANEGRGLDFTMDDEHEIVEIVSGTANFNTDEWSTWRTSFREALKLRANTDEISKKRLEFWLTTSMGKFSEYSTEGAQHAVEYYESVNGDFDKLKLSYDWPWLKEYFNDKYN